VRWYFLAEQKEVRGKGSAGSKRGIIVREEKPTRFEKITLEFNVVYNELLASIRDRDTKAAQEKFMKLYSIYRKISKEKLTKAEIQALERQLMDVADLIPSEEPPMMLMPLLLLVGIITIMFFFEPAIIGLFAYENDSYSHSTMEMPAFEADEAIGYEDSLAVRQGTQSSSLPFLIYIAILLALCLCWIWNVNNKPR